MNCEFYPISLLLGNQNSGIRKASRVGNNSLIF